MRHWFLYSLFLLLSVSSYAQRKCGTVAYNKQLGNTETKQAFEKWMLQKQQEIPAHGQKSFAVTAVTVYQIPVVVHVIHNGEPIGTGSNISDAQILSQIQVLNKDFRAQNADSSNIPSVFKPLYSDIGFEFVLAKRDPNNAITTGITRTQGSKTSWAMSDDATLKATNYWPAEDYFNIWVAPLSGGFLGWAQFPESNQLAGLEPPFNATTDGVVINYNAFGSIAIDPNANLQARFNLGRTTTHEVGHFFGLRHIWGDGGCGIDDYVADTPEAASEYFNCPVLGPSSTSCGSQDMFMNYMDYVDDNCMHMFSAGQRDRMVIIIENSPRRLSLTTSPALVDPSCQDITITQFTEPLNGICNNQTTPAIEIKNNGTCTITEVDASLFINQIAVNTKKYKVNLAPNTTTLLTFDTQTLTEFGNLAFTGQIDSIDGTAAVTTETNILTINSLHAETVTELSEDFSVPNAKWTINTDQEISAINIAPSLNYSTNNQAAVFEYYQNSPGTDAYISPRLFIPDTKQALLFDYSYGYAGADDNLSVLVSTNCGVSFDDVIFSASGSHLATATSPVPFYPGGPQDWHFKRIDLSSYANQEIIFSFKAVSDGGNRILIDNIRVKDSNYTDLALQGIPAPAIPCSTTQEVYIAFTNKGNTTIESTTMEYVLNGTTNSVTFTQLGLLPGQDLELPLALPEQTNTQAISFSLTTPDDNLENNSFTQLVPPVLSTTHVPMRERLTQNTAPQNVALTTWVEEGNSGWEANPNGLKISPYKQSAKGIKSSILLPPLDMTDLVAASMHFDFSYAYDGFNQELLSVLALDDCGQTLEVLFEQGGEALAITTQSSEWVPTGSTDWKDIYVDLSDLAGNNPVQLVVELTGAQGNNAYIKNIELYASNIENPLQLPESTLTVYPNPSATDNITLSFNVSEVQPATLVVFNAQGSKVYEKQIGYALNQSFTINTALYKNGLYIARLVGANTDLSRSFIISR